VFSGAVVAGSEVGGSPAGSGTYPVDDGAVVSVAELGGASWWVAARAGAATPRVLPPTIEVARVTATAWSATRRASGRVAQPTARTAAGSLVRLASR
jgi:hypothetical protein